jgi:hypothetical protein
MAMARDARGRDDLGPQTVQARLPTQAVRGLSQLDMCLLCRLPMGAPVSIQSPGAGADSVLSTHDSSCPLRSFIVPIVMGHFYPLGRFQ